MRYSASFFPLYFAKGVIKVTELNLTMPKVQPMEVKKNFKGGRKQSIVSYDEIKMLYGSNIAHIPDSAHYEIYLANCQECADEEESDVKVFFRIPKIQPDRASKERHYVPFDTLLLDNLETKLYGFLIPDLVSRYYSGSFCSRYDVVPVSVQEDGDSIVYNMVDPKKAERLLVASRSDSLARGAESYGEIYLRATIKGREIYFLEMSLDDAADIAGMKNGESLREFLSAQMKITEDNSYLERRNSAIGLAG